MNASLHRRFAPLLVAVVVAGSWVLGARARSGERKDAVAAERPLRVEQVVPLSSQPHEADPSVIWYDSFDGEPRAYAEGDLPQIATERLGDQGGSREMRYRKGTVGAGGLKLFFGDSPTYAAQTVRRGEVFDDVYWRVYVKHAADWQGGGPAKLSRATSLVPPGWRQAMIAHVWSSGDALTLDPASGVRDGEVVTRKYNDFERLRWLGNKPVSPIRVHSSDEAGRWVCIESRAKLNTPGESDGLNQLWIDGQLQCERRDLDWRGTYADHGINAVFLEGYWNAGSPVDQSRWLDGFVVSTAPIGPVVCARRPILCMASPEGRTGDVVAEIAPVGDEERVLWRSTPFPATTPRIEVNAETGRFAKSVRDARLPAEATLHVRLRAADDDEYGPWHQAFRTARRGVGFHCEKEAPVSAAFIILRQKRIIRRFADAGAWSPDTARTTDEVGCGQNWLFERLLARGVLHRAGDDRYHLDAEGIRRYRHRLRTFAAVSLILMGIGIAVLALV